MSKTKNKILTAMLALLFVAVSAVMVSHVFAEDVLHSITDIPATQEYGVNYQIPKLKMDVGNKEVIAKTLLYKPDGTVVSGKATTLDMAGEYTLLFVGTDNGLQKIETAKFKVMSPMVTFSSKGNTATYYSDENDSGILINATSATVAHFNKIIDISQLTKDDTFIRFKAVPTYPGTNEIEKIEIVLTDIYDENNYLTFRVKSVSSSADVQVYMDAAASGQIYSARNRVNNASKLYKNSQFGYTCFSNFSGKEKLLGYGGKNAHSTPYFELRYDYDEMTVYSHSPNGGLALKDKERKYESIITFNSLDDFDNVWKGFTNGKVKVSIKATGTAANYIVTDLYGINLTELYIEDKDAPVITIDSPDEIPTSIINAEYKLFDASAYDLISGKTDVNMEVWFNLNSDKPVSVPIIDGKFKTVNPGIYSVIYSSKDNYGNIATEVIKIFCDAVESNITFDTSPVYNEVKQGDEVYFKDVKVHGGAGSLSIEVMVTGGDYTAIENGFIPHDNTTYKVNYIATDYVGSSKVLSVDVVVNYQAIPVFTNQPILNEFLVSGYKYILPEIYAIDYADAGVEKKANIIVEDKNGQRILEGTEYTPEILINGDTTKIIFKVEGKGGVNQIEKNIKVIIPKNDENNVTLENFFVYSDNTSVSYALNGMIFATNNTSEIKFINPVIADKFNSIFDISANARLTLTLTDKINIEQKFTVEFYSNGTNVLANINDEVTYTSKFLSEASNDLAIKIDVINKSITFGGKKVEIINMPEFDSNYAYVQFMIESVNDEKANMIINEINGFRFREISSDNSGPQIILYVEQKSADIYSTAKTASVKFLDVLNTYAECKVSVISPNGSYVQSVDGVLLNGQVSAEKVYEFICSEYGIYTVTYVAKDGAGAISRQQYMIRVWDGEPPTIIVNQIASVQKLNATVTLNSGSATDNVSGKCAIYISVKSPDGKVLAVKGSKYTFTMKGDYEFTYFATDKNGNISFYSYIVTVK